MRGLFEGWRVAAQEVPPAELIGAVLDESGYRAELEAENTVESESRLENLEELINAAREYERVEPEPTLFGFLQEQALYSEQDALSGEGGRAALMTLHNAKGLEYDHVFVVGHGGGYLPARPLARRAEPGGGAEARVRRHHAREEVPHPNLRQAALQLGRARVPDALAFPVRDTGRSQVRHRDLAPGRARGMGDGDVRTRRGRAPEGRLRSRCLTAPGRGYGTPGSALERSSRPGTGRSS